MTLVAALYVDPRGPYPRLLEPELCWDEARDARTPIAFAMWLIELAALAGRE